MIWEEEPHSPNICYVVAYLLADTLGVALDGIGQKVPQGGALFDVLQSPSAKFVDQGVRVGFFLDRPAACKCLAVAAVATVVAHCFSIVGWFVWVDLVQETK